MRRKGLGGESEWSVSRKKKKFCGNCGSRNPSSTRQGCSTRYAQNKNPIVDTLWCSNDWNIVIQECHSVRDALKKKTARHATLKLLQRIRVLMA